MRDFARIFYSSKAWKECRAAYRKSRGGLCEECLKRGMYRPGEIVHHKEHITPDTITDERVLLDWNNLQLVCRDCHGAMHRDERRFDVDSLGRISPRG